MAQLTDLPLFWFLVACVGIPVYLFPALVGKNHHNAHAILILTLLLGWTYVGWALALVWAVTKPPLAPMPPDPLYDGPV